MSIPDPDRPDTVWVPASSTQEADNFRELGYPERDGKFKLPVRVVQSMATEWFRSMS